MVIVKYLIQFHEYEYIGIFTVAYVGYQTKNMIWLPMSIQAGMFASLFVYLGVIARRKGIMEYRKNPIMLSALMGIWIFCILYEGYFYLVQNYAGNGFLDIIGALAASYLIILFSKFIAEKTDILAAILRFWGRNTLIILCIHNFELKVVSWHWIKEFAGRICENQVVYYCMLVIIKMLFCTLGVWIIKRAKLSYLNYIKPRMKDN